jgi:transposase
MIKCVSKSTSRVAYSPRFLLPTERLPRANSPALILDGPTIQRWCSQQDLARSGTEHVVLDNLSAPMGPEVTRWLDHPKRTRWHLHFTPTSSSWLNLVERWFKALTDRRLRRGTFSSVGELVDAIELWAEHWNHDPKPFIWHKTAEEIIAKTRRGRAALTQAKSATHH